MDAMGKEADSVLRMIFGSVRPGCVVSGCGPCLGCIAYAATVAAVLAYHVAWRTFTTRWAPDPSYKWCYGAPKSRVVLVITPVTHL